MNTTSKIYIPGHTGLVGSAVMRLLASRGYENLITRSSKDLDLCRQAEAEAFFEAERPEYVVLCAAKVGGILANSTYPADFIYDNLLIAANVIHAAYKTGVAKLVNLGSSCIYPKLSNQPLKEEYLLTGPLEKTNEAYALAKIAAVKLCRHYNDQYGTCFISAMPTNLYGPGDNFDLTTSHVLPALIRKFHEAKQTGSGVTLWGDGSPYREFMYVDDLAEALLFIMEQVTAADLKPMSPDYLLNVGTGEDLTIGDLAALVAETVGFTGAVTWDVSKPNGTPRKLLDVSRIQSLGWKASTPLKEGLERTYEWYYTNLSKGG